MLVGVDLDVDPDEMHLQVAIVIAELDGGAIYDEFAVALNLAMLDDDRRASYRAIWGEDWTEIPPLAGADLDGLTPDAAAERESTTAVTILSTPRARHTP